MYTVLKYTGKDLFSNKIQLRENENIIVLYYYFR